jgi:hypothetical protein
MKRILFYSTAIIIVTLVICACEKKDKYEVSNYFSPQQQDSLLVNMVTYIGKKPKLANWQTRHEPQHEEYYRNLSKSFKFGYFHITPDSTHYYYLVRPARSAKGNTSRGVGGKLKLGNNFQLNDFEEVFNTPILSEQELLEVGNTLFIELINTGNVNRYLNNKNLIEWPDDRLRYDKKKKEWRYDVID